ncbi:hypothetical protein HH214_04010 [Mucilaginibacter robiniae]|uniref:Aerotolerance regulator N-terminal domain-containing protein n=1 Tax=Mucilaginibacter robiniae TaxID=2728022 RepID=A0A7L5DVI4_9SPHI|nr:BatA domain-containing protein [Mucilaginibacter robiniae]QJD95100.1 hypothetical protein HH214_04010 [Mucilaginibacter robiniae]
MFQFLNPIWLLAGTAVIIPVVIHLWNIRPGKVLKVGSISLIDAASRKSSRSFKLLDIPLFILRCLLLITLALLLALPVWQKHLTLTKAKGWILFPKETFTATYRQFKPRIDSLTKAGYEFHYFDRNFSKSNLQQILLHPQDSIRKDTAAYTPDYWNMLRQLDTKVASSLPLYVFTPNRASYFTGNKPQVALNLHWQTYTPADSASTWVQQAYFTGNKNIRVVQGNGTTTGITYRYANIQQGNQANSAYSVNVNNGQPTVSLKDQANTAAAIDTTTLRIAVYTDNYTTDAAYLQAALKAVSQFTQQKSMVKLYSNAQAIPAGQTWLFWLSEKPISSRLLQQSKNVLTYEKGKIMTVRSWMDNSNEFSTASQQVQKVALFKMVSSNRRESPIWRDGYGHAVLGLKLQGTHQAYHFYSRFNPAWNDLVWSSEFPNWLLQLLTGNTVPVNKRFDKRVLTHEQLMPLISTETHETVTKITGYQDLTHYCWLVLILLFLAERWLANRTPKTATHD